VRRKSGGHRFGNVGLSRCQKTMFANQTPRRSRMGPKFGEQTRRLLETNECRVIPKALRQWTGETTVVSAIALPAKGNREHALRPLRIDPGEIFLPVA
jgi:hypothetical protein